MPVRRPVAQLGVDEERGVVEVDVRIGLVEVQATGEQGAFSRQQFDQLMDLAAAGVSQLAALQQEALAPILEQVDALERKGPRREAAPQDEKELWGKP